MNLNRGGELMLGDNKDGNIVNKTKVKSAGARVISFKINHHINPSRGHCRCEKEAVSRGIDPTIIDTCEICPYQPRGA